MITAPDTDSASLWQGPTRSRSRYGPATLTLIA